MDRAPLFSDGELYHALEATRKGVAEDVANYDPDQLLAQAEDDVVNYFVEKWRSNAPVLRRQEMYIDSHGEARIDVSQRWDYNVFDRSRRAYITGTAVEVVVPFDGDPKLFMMTPSTRTTCPPVGEVRPGEVRLTFESLQRPDPATLKTQIDRRVDEIAQHLAWTHQLTDPYDEELPGFVTDLVQTRKKRLLDAKGLVAELGIPVRHRDDPGTFALPVKRHVVPIAPPPQVGTPFAAEPTFVNEDFEAALRIIRGARNSFERSPSMTATLDEENIRNLILVALNGHFEGAAGGELFNGIGKTDILIREADRNVFIGECKFWTGPKGFTQAIDQLLGYVVWRDAKAVLLLFIRQPSVTEIVEKAATVLAGHPRCKRNHGGNVERWNFTFQAEGDPSRELQLVLLPFALPGRASPS